MSRPELHFVIATPQQSINILYIINNQIRHLILPYFAIIS